MMAWYSRARSSLSSSTRRSRVISMVWSAGGLVFMRRGWKSGDAVTTAKARSRGRGPSRTRFGALGAVPRLSRRSRHAEAAHWDGVLAGFQHRAWLGLGEAVRV